MRKKELKKEILLLEQMIRANNGINNDKLVSLQKNINALQSKVDKKFNELEKSDMEISEDIGKVQDERWEMLKDYLGVKEEEYAELNEVSCFRGGFIGMPSFSVDKTPVKKTKLVKIKKSKK